MDNISNIKKSMHKESKTWLITGVAGFIGSNILNELLKHNQKVIGIDNFETGFKSNIDEVLNGLPEHSKKQFTFIEDTIHSYDACLNATKNVDIVLHQAALGSVPRSIKDPINSHKANVDGFVNIIEASRINGIKNFVFASSSSVYGDSKLLPKKEEMIGIPLSPYALTKSINEQYAKIYNHVYDFNFIGLRYFNVFGTRQSPEGEYAAVIPKWISAIINNKEVYVNGDGSTTRDFCYIKNVVEMNILSAYANKEAQNTIYNVACGKQNSLHNLYNIIKNSLASRGITYSKDPIFKNFRDGDIKDSLASIKTAKNNLGYCPKYNLEQGINDSIEWYLNKNKK